MVIDTSALMAILLGELEAEAFARALAGNAKFLLSAFSALEAAIIIESKKGAAGSRELDLLLHRARIEIIPFTPEQQEIALSAWRRFGKGRHPASLNIGDCCSYALARLTNEPLLFKGDDFLQTDITPVSLPQVE